MADAQSKKPHRRASTRVPDNILQVLPPKKVEAVEERAGSKSFATKIYNLIIRSAEGVQEFGGVEIDDIDESTSWALPIAVIYFIMFFASLAYFTYTGTIR